MPGEQAGDPASVNPKDAAEDLVRNGIFVSWAQLVATLLVFTCAVVIARLLLDRNAQTSIKQAWKTEWRSISAAVLEGG